MAVSTLKRVLRHAALAAGVGLGLALVAQSWQLGRDLRVNRQLEAQLAGEDERAGRTGAVAEDPRLWIAAARKPALAGRTVEAAALLRRAADASRGELREMALYDMGNVYFRAALWIRAEGADAPALPLFELAKESYRAALLERPDLWDAKFNLELALRAAPDTDTDDAGATALPTSERAVTTMRALTLGLP